ncbi:MAG: hypothetical protein PUD92_05200, partial [Clostridiales bacterium]|nr:hypothetical protein [Clostridiales bacterium]
LTNASGGKYDGQYRQLLVKDRFDKEQMVCFSVWGTNGGYTSLVCGIEINSQLISKLQIRLDVCLKSSGNGRFVLTHNGIRSRKSIKSMMDYVRAECPELISGNEIFLCSFDNNKNITMDLPEVKDFMLRLISYLILRKELSIIEANNKKQS